MKRVLPQRPTFRANRSFARTPAEPAMLAALAAVFLGAVDLTVISTVLPRIVVDLEINTADIDRYIWVVNAYLIAYIVAIPLIGRLSDVLGRRVAFELAVAVFALGSVGSAVARDLGELIACRAVQGAGGGALLPIAMALAGDLFPRGKRSTALGIVAAVDTLGWVLGPLWGAAVSELAGDTAHAWRWVFWINLPVAVLVAIVIHRRLPRESGDQIGERGAVDVVGAILLGGSLVLLELGLSSGGEAGVRTGSAFRAFGGTSNPMADDLWWLVLGGVLMLVAFVWWERRSKSPLVPVVLARDRVFLAAQAANLLIGAALITAMVNVPLTAALLVAENRIGLVSALLLAPFTLLMAATSFIGGVIASEHGARRTAIAGSIAVLIGYVAIWAGLRSHGELGMLPGLCVAGAGFGVVVAPIGSSVIDHASAQHRGIAAASTIFFRLLGMTVSLSGLTAFGIHRLQSLSNQAPPIDRSPGETTADFFLRQNRYIQEVAIPIAVRVVGETFLIAASLALVATLPMLFLPTRKPGRSA